jgi:hypothetical protein
MDSIVWRDTTGKRLWMSYANDLSSFTISDDRPISDLDFNSNQRYSYDMYQAQ